MKLHAFSGFDRTPYLKAHEDLAKLDPLELDDLTHLPQCDLFWRRTVDGFHAVMDDKTCVYDLEGDRVYADYQMMLSDRALWKGDVIRRLSDDQQVNAEPIVLHKQNRARFFICSITLEEDDAVQRHSDLKVSDQGGKAWVDAPSDQYPGRQIAIRIRNVRWAMNNNPVTFTNDSFVMYIDEKTAAGETNIAYAWSAPETGRMGINLHWLQAHCSIKPLTETRPYL